MALKLASGVKGLSEIEFRERFGIEEQCRTAIAAMRWRDGFICPACGHKGHAYLKKRGHWQCNRCKHQVSVTAGTIFHSTIDRRAVDPSAKQRMPEACEGCL